MPIADIREMTCSNRETASRRSLRTPIKSKRSTDVTLSNHDLRSSTRCRRDQIKRGDICADVKSNDSINKNCAS